MQSALKMSEPRIEVTRASQGSQRSKAGINKIGTAVALGTLASLYLLFAHRRKGQASISDTIRLGLGVALPTLAMGPIIRRPGIMKLAEKMDFNGHAVKSMRRVRELYGRGPILLSLPMRKQAVILDFFQMRQVLNESPEIYSIASSEKISALKHFEPNGVIISPLPERLVRRQVNEGALQHNHSIHTMFARFLPVVDFEMQALLKKSSQYGRMDWHLFQEAWFRVIRRVIFGDRARNDERITIVMTKLRGNANWAFLKSVDTELRQELLDSIQGYLDDAEPGSVAAFMRSRFKANIGDPQNQVPQWLFAFDATAMAIFRTLALLTAHPDMLERVRSESDGGIAEARPLRPFTRACVVDSLRLWPTTPMILRQTTRDTSLGNEVLPKGTGVLIYTPYFHRDETRIPFAHTFNPDFWIDEDPEVQGNPPFSFPFAPFSGGKGICPGRNLALMLSSGAIAALVGNNEIQLKSPIRINPSRLPGTLNPYTLQFQINNYQR
jgi:hypothetical protein